MFMLLFKEDDNICINYVRILNVDLYWNLDESRDV